MRTNPLIHHLSFVALALSAFMLSTNPARSCGFSECELEECKSFFAPEIINSPANVPFFIGVEHESLQPSSVKSIDDINLDEWGLSFAPALTRMNAQILQMPETKSKDIDELIFFLKGESTQIDARLKPLAQALQEPSSVKRAIKMLFYFGFVKRVEAFVKGARELHWDPPAGPTQIEANAKEDINHFIQSGEKQAAQVADTFLEQRYRFQILRLYFYSHQYSEVIASFEKNRTVFATDIKEDSRTYSRSISFQALHYLAGSHFKLGHYGESNYLYSLIFDQYLPLRTRATLDFKPQEEADFNQTLERSRNTRQRIAIWQMVGLKHDGLRAIEQIFALDPASDLTLLLLVNEINLIERRLHLKSTEISTWRVSAATLSSLRKITDSPKNAQALLWQTSLSYLYALNGDLELSEKYAVLAEAGATLRPDVQNQLIMNRALIHLRQMNPPNLEHESKIALALKQLSASSASERPRNSTFIESASTHLAQFYRRAGSRIKAYLAKGIDPGDDACRDNRFLNSVIAFQKNRKPSSMDSYLLQKKPLGSC